MKRALIGYTGFVGSNLYVQKKIDCCYNSKNFLEMKGREFDEIICAGVSAVKWQANKEPTLDKERILKLQEVLTTVSSKRFVLISTIDVYPANQAKDESFNCHSLENHAYGKHRLEFEDFCKEHFTNCNIIRLPGLFGPGLKKNIIYDLLNDNCLEMLNPSSSFQYYYLKNLWNDIHKTIQSNVRIINFFTEPVSTRAIMQRFFPDKKVGQQAGPEVHYDLHTSYAHLWDKKGFYMYSRDEILSQLGEFIKNYNNRNKV